MSEASNSVTLSSDAVSPTDTNGSFPPHQGPPGHSPGLQRTLIILVSVLCAVILAIALAVLVIVLRKWKRRKLTRMEGCKDIVAQVEEARTSTASLQTQESFANDQDEAEAATRLSPSRTPSVISTSMATVGELHPSQTSYTPSSGASKTSPISYASLRRETLRGMTSNRSVASFQSLPESLPLSESAPPPYEAS